jgi:hypothetical protein
MSQRTKYWYTIQELESAEEEARKRGEADERQRCIAAIQNPENKTKSAVVAQIKAGSS